MSSSLPRLEVALEALLGNRLGAGVYRRWVRGLGLTGTERVLDVGCGAGACVRHIAAALPAGSLTCLDVDARWLAIARKRLTGYDRAEFTIGDITRWKRAGAFDAATLHFVLHDIAGEQRDAALGNIAESLAPGGRLFIREPTGHGMSAEELLGLLDRSGFRMRGPAVYEKLPLMGETIAAEWVIGA
ncbi:MAG: hypothetical protein CVT66_07620 [Actinobacteria bacterium HGW-Actinobacteria-6]|jgi:ubiquinone/menaquinone biosynthesis C-methylase UbiE|nr:MAG: hypothetical protein CVT66_07620 [Actinobacteria bacterium HGW-Actinobacteria-6]